MADKDDLIKSEPVDGANARAALRQLGLKPMEGGNNDRFEIWLTQSGHPHCVPYYKAGDKDRFLGHAFNAIIDDLT